MMQPIDGIGALLILVVLIGIIRILVKPPSPSPAERPRGPIEGFLGGAFVNGILSAVAVGTVMQSSSNPWLAGLTTGAVVGALFGLMAGTGELKQLAVNGMSLLFGAVGLIVTVGAYFNPALSCTPADVGQRVLGLLLVLVALVIGGALTWFRGIFSLTKLGPTVLAVFGAISVVEFLSSPLGVALVDLGVTAWIVALVAALALGFAASISPELVIGVASLTIVAGIVIGSASGAVTSTCLPGRDLSGLAPLIGFAVVYWAVHIVVGRRLARATQSSSEAK